MQNPTVTETRLSRLKKLESFLANVDNQLKTLTKHINWDYAKLLEEVPDAEMVTCSYGTQLHRVPRTKVQEHEKKCKWHAEGYRDDDKLFPPYSGNGSFINLNSDILHKITGAPGDLSPRPVPNTSQKLDQNFSREEKLSIYNYVIANTQKQKEIKDIYLEPLEKKEEKRELSAWEIAAAERDAKRRRASYRNKVHTKNKSHTEVLREVIESQMEILKEETSAQTKSPPAKSYSPTSKHSSSRRTDSRDRHHSSRHSSRYSSHESRSRHRHHSHKHHKSSRRSGSESRSRDRHRKHKVREERSHSRHRPYNS